MLMEWLSDARYRLRAIFKRAVVERELDEELRFHLEREADKYERAGESREDAMRHARVAFGGIERIKDDSRDTRGLSLLETLDQDLRYAVRGLRLKPAFAIAVVLTLALGIGANAAMFGIVDQLLFRAPAYLRDPGSVSRVYLLRNYNGKQGTQRSFEYTRYLDLTRWSTAFSSTAAFSQRQLAVGAGEDARELSVGTVSASFFGFFDARPAIGRFFDAQEDLVPQGSPVVVLGYPYWQTQYGGRADVLGKQLRVGALSYTIIGVAPKYFAGVPDAEEAPVLFVPITSYAGTVDNGKELSDYYTSYHWGWVQMLARRKPGVSAADASADLTRAYARSYAAERALSPSTTLAEIARPHALAAPIQSDRGPNESEVAKVAKWVSGVAIIVLLIACANVANLLLARALRRRREIALRIALGISRTRLIKQLLTESLLLAMLGGVAGVVVGHWSGALLRSLFLPNSTRSALGDPRTLMFAALVALIAGLLTGLAPALQSGRDDLAATLKAGAREGTYHRSRIRNALLIAQGALSVVLLIGAGLFVRSLQNVRALRLGYDVDPVLYVLPNLRGMKLSDDAAMTLTTRLLDEAKTIPGVVTATRAITVPFWNTWSEDLFVAGIDSVSRLGEFTLQSASPEYFQTMGTRIMRGRGMSSEDRKNAPPVIVVSDAMASTLWPHADAIGQCIRVGADTSPCSTVVGIAENIKQNSLNDRREMQYYLPIDQFHPAAAALFVRAHGDAAQIAESVRRRLQRLMPGASYVTTTPMTEIVSPQMRSWQLGATMFLAFGALALVLAAVGLYSVIAYNVAQRSHELAVRVALGAQRGDVLRIVIGEGVRFAVAGIAIGSVLALAAGRWAKPLLFAESPADPAVFGVVTAVLLAVALGASVVPALRATRVDPNSVLRAE